MNKPASRPLHPARQFVVLLFIVVGFWYLHWRLGTFNEIHPVFSRILYAAEVFGFVTALLNVFMTWRLTVRRAPPPVAGLKIDVFIPTYNEDVEMVRRTALAARAMDYPHQTWILDDGARPAMRYMAASLGLHYLARSDNADAKAGNLNHALPHSQADFIVTFDADHAPRRDFLVKTLGYFADEKVAFVQTPQDFYNLDSFQNRTDPTRRVAWSEQSLFFRVIQRGKDYWNAAFYCGSCAVIRRQSLDRIGGFATGTVTEDLHTSLRLHKLGYRSVYHDESLAYGVAPAKIGPFLKQRVRWGVGAMNVWRKEGILFTRGLSLAQRVNYLATVLAYFDGWQKAFFYFAPVYVLMAGAMPIGVDGGVFLWHFVPYIALNFLAFEEIARGYGRSFLIEQYNMARFASFAWSTLGMFRIRTRFGVTAKKTSERSPMLPYLLPQMAVIGLNVAAIPVGILLFYSVGRLPQDGMWANVVWATINAGLALMVVRFTRRQSDNRRDEYRFHFPVAARLGGVLGTVDDLSPRGLSFYGSIGEPAVGTRLPLVLYLPDGPLQAELEIRSAVYAEQGSARYTRLVGGAFHGLPLAEEQRIEQFLYGSNIQRELNRYQEDSLTPLQRLAWVPKPAIPPAVRYWASCEISQQGMPTLQQIGLAGSLARKGEVELLVNQTLDSAHPLTLAVHSRSGIRTLRASVGESDVLPTGGGTLYRYRAHLEESSAVMRGELAAVAA
ncbi:MAG TPA: glycosyltransferase family 2 protein [Thiobacillus sp.]